MKRFGAILLSLILASGVSYGTTKGWIQNEDVKSLSDIESAINTITGNLTISQPCISSPSSLAKLFPGAFAYDPGLIPANTTIVAIPGTCSAGQIQLSHNASNNATATTITFGGQPSQMVNDSKIYLTGGSANVDLATAINTNLIPLFPSQSGHPGQFLKTDGTSVISWTNQLTVSNQMVQDTFYGDGSTTTFTLSFTPPAAAGVVVSNDGSVLVQGVSNDYTVASNVVTMNTAPAPGQVILAVYSKY